MGSISAKNRTYGSINRANVLIWVGLGVLFAATPCFAQTDIPGVDLRYDTLLKRQDRNKTTPGNEFGDQHGIESGSLSFNVVDVDLPGSNGLVVEFRRTLTATDPKKSLTTYSYTYPTTRLGDWAFGLPRIEGTYDAAAGWISGDPDNPTKNCSVSSRIYVEPPPGQVDQPWGQQFPADTFPAHMFWNPPTLHYPDGSSGLLVYNNEGTLPVPSTGGPYKWITTSQDIVSCIATLKNKNVGEGYLVTRPDGTKYWFDWMAQESLLPSTTTAALTGGCSGDCGPTVGEVRMQQATLALYPTRVEDRFGNWVTYTYSNGSNELVKLERIQSSDGRVIDIAYPSGSLMTVTANGRTWTYISDAGERLTEVRNPDGSSWRYSGESHPFPPQTIQRPCENLGWTQYVNPDPTTVGDTDFQGYTVDAPSGARAVFRVAAVMLGRSAVLDGCYTPGTNSDGTAVQVPRRFLGGYRLALTGKKVTGPGLSPAIWKYHYQSDIGFAPMANGTSRTKVLNPDGSLDTYTFGNTYLVDEGLQLAHTRASSTGQVLLSETNTYATGITNPGFPKLIGYFPDAADRTPSTFLRPKLSTTKIVQSTQFKWAVNNNCSVTPGTALCLDSLARPTSVTKSSSPAP